MQKGVLHSSDASHVAHLSGRNWVKIDGQVSEIHQETDRFTQLHIHSEREGGREGGRKKRGRETETETETDVYYMVYQDIEVWGRLSRHLQRVCFLKFANCFNMIELSNVNSSITMHVLWHNNQTMTSSRF